MFIGSTIEPVERFSRHGQLRMASCGSVGLRHFERAYLH
jgi:hypothetical protein